VPIRLAPEKGFAEIPDDVLEKIKELRASRAKQISSELNRLKLEKATQPGQYRTNAIDAELKSLTMSFASLKKTGGGNVLDGARRGGLSGIMMRMRRLPYEKFYLKSRKGTAGPQDWIIGLTQTIMCEIDMTHRGPGGVNKPAGTKYDMGKYYIAILCQAVGTHTPTFHLLPESDPSTMARHMHHHVRGSHNTGKKNPLDWTPANCYGTFSGAIVGSFQNADIPELFRMLHIFTKTMNPASPLIDIPQLPHVREVT
jgi:hypothetical protein